MTRQAPAASQLLDSCSLIFPEGAPLPLRVCVEHLSLLGARPVATPVEDYENARSPLRLTLQPNPGSSDAGSIDCLVKWLPRESPFLCDEALIQALSGLMAIHGRDRGVPRRLGLEIASVAAGVLAAQGILAALISKARGHNVSRVQTSVAHGALMFLYHHLAIATCSDHLPFCPAESGTGPPFPTADGHWIEIEVMSGESWRMFWSRVGMVDSGIVGAAWLPYVYRYLAGRCVLPFALSEATRKSTLSALERIAAETGIGLCCVRSYSDLIADFRLGKRPWTVQAGSPHQKERSSSAAPNLPLAGLRVVEVTSRLQGPLAGLLLQMLGAEVIKVEPPGGDFGKFSRPAAGEIGAAYLAYNRRKRVVEIDYKLARGRQQLLELIVGADVFLHNWRMGRAEDLGLNFESLCRFNPRLVAAHASGWGHVKQEPCPIAGDFLVQAHAACGDGLNPIGEPPFPSRLTLLDVMGGLLSCEAILVGLCLRELHCCGSRVDTSLLDSAISLQSEVLESMVRQRELFRRAGRPLWGVFDRPIATGEGFLMVRIEGLDAAKRFLDLCDVNENLRAENVEAEIVAKFGARPADEWHQRCCEAGIPSAVVRTNLASLAADPQFGSLIERANDACWVPTAPWQFGCESASNVEVGEKLVEHAPMVSLPG